MPKKKQAPAAPVNAQPKPAPSKPAKQQKKAAPANERRHKKSVAETPQSPVKITFLGGLNEIGKNMTLVEYENEGILIDCGMAFPDDDMFGVDVVLPDFTHVIKNADRIRGIVLTHAHEDHIGGLPYLLREIKLPIYGAKLTLAMVESKLKEAGLAGSVPLHEVSAGSVVPFGRNLSVEFIHVNHSIPDAMALGIKTPQGYVVHTGDFKIDTTPISGGMMDLAHFGALGNAGVLALLADSTNAERPGYTPSESIVGESFTNLFQKAEDKRVIVATFSSNLYRIQQIINASARDGRKVAISGRSMINLVQIATELGYLSVPANTLIELDQIRNYPKNRVTLITTGSQGEPMSALSRMAFEDHRQVTIGPDDYIIISATPIPGNEKAVGRVVDELLRHGCEVIYEKMYDVHTSGHACQEELKIVHGLTKPRYFLPVHGEQKHLRKHAGLAKRMGMDASRIMIANIGQVVSLTKEKMQVTETVPAGRVLVDGIGMGDVGSIVLRDRRRLAEDGLVIVVATIDSATSTLVSGPDIVSRGFVYVRDAEPLMEKMRELAEDTLDRCLHSSHRDWMSMKSQVRDNLSKLIFQQTKRSPMILPVIMEV
ncbi:MAG: RNase J family beta-CASP ribonuclease [Clostridia bacterium]|nr:RNase J family beta-CASP ribonuclease [Clostridia bacterium]